MIKRQRSIVILLTLIFMVSAVPCTWAENGPSVSADAAILIDLQTGQILYGKNPYKKRPPASTTKVMTALLALESGRLKDRVTVSTKAARTEGSSMYLAAGEVVPMTDLLYGALMKSGNDACEAIAEHVGGSSEKFAVLMNLKALALGTVNTNFVNPHGLPNEEHYTCAYDLALIARAALKNQLFSNIVDTRDKVVAWPGQKWQRSLQNTNKLLWRYLWADGVKTGTTNAAGQCLISSASKGSRQLVAVVLHSGDRWGESIRMFEYGFNSFEYKQVAVAGVEFGRYKVQNGVREEVPVAYASSLGVLLPVHNKKALEKKVSFSSYPVAPVRAGQVLGSERYYVNKCFAGKVDLISTAAVGELGLWDKIVRWWGARF